MQLHKFYHVGTGELVYAVTGAKSRIDAFKFVSQYKKMKYSNMFLTHKVVKGMIENDEDLYVNNFTGVDGVNCWIIARNNIKFNKR